MERFIHNENLKMWRRQLAETNDEQKRTVLADLIAREEARETEIEPSAGTTRSGPKMTPL